MPIATCLVIPQCARGTDDLIQLWANASGKPKEHMTINLVTSSDQLGNRYKIMADLKLPSLWSTDEISSIQLGLAKALAQHFSVSIEEVHVVTQIVASGLVVEAGQEIKW